VKSLASLCLLLLLSAALGAQPDSTAQKPPRFTATGYVKYLQSGTLAKGIGSPLTNNLIHHRLNLRWYPAPRWQLALEFRNRAFYGEQIKLDPTYAEHIDQYAGLADLSVRWVDEPSFLLHCIVDRAYAAYSSPKWDIRLGRQRINWGVNLSWNPNDLFNALNFLDFDYEERPGNDALRVQYFPGQLSRVELAVAPGRYDTTSIAAALYRGNVQGYDIQAIAGYYKGDLALGGGWEGSIGGLGFKGEATWFHSLEGLSSDSLSALSASLSFDYLLGSGVFLSLGGLYNQDGGRAGLNGSGLFGNSLAASSLSARNLFPAEFALLGQASYQPHPLLSLSGGLLYGNQNHLSAFIPSITYSIRENWDLDLIGQSFFADVNGYTHVASALFLRLKWSY
jgi:hypothetical protein